MTVYVASSFSLNMLMCPADIKVGEADDAGVRALLAEAGDFVSVVGHEGSAKAMSDLLGVDVKLNRVPVTLREGDIVVVYLPSSPGGRPPEGKVMTVEELRALPHKWYIVTVGRGVEHELPSRQPPNAAPHHPEGTERSR